MSIEHFLPINFLFNEPVAEPVAAAVASPEANNNGDLSSREIEELVEMLRSTPAEVEGTTAMADIESMLQQGRKIMVRCLSGGPVGHRPAGGRQRTLPAPPNNNYLCRF